MFPLGSWKLLRWTIPVPVVTVLTAADDVVVVVEVVVAGRWLVELGVDAVEVVRPAGPVFVRVPPLPAPIVGPTFAVAAVTVVRVVLGSVVRLGPAVEGWVPVTELTGATGPGTGA